MQCKGSADEAFQWLARGGVTHNAQCPHHAGAADVHEVLQRVQLSALRVLWCVVCECGCVSRKAAGSNDSRTIGGGAGRGSQQLVF